MRHIPYKTVIRILIADGMALMLMVLVLWALVAASNPAKANDQAELTQPIEAIASAAAAPIPVGLLPELREGITLTSQSGLTLTLPASITAALHGDITSTLEVIAESLGDLRQPSVSVNRASLPDWVVEPVNAGDQRTAGVSLSVVKSVETGTGDNTFIFNGGTIVYTITAVNNSDQTINGISLYDMLPENTLSNVRCRSMDNCEIIYDTVVITPGSLQFPVTISNPIAIRWEIDSLPPFSRAEKVFWGRVTCQADGAVFKNQVFANQGGGTSEVETLTRVQVERIGGASLSAGSTFCSEDLGGTHDMDWGDFDGDGDLDLALGSQFGTTLYRNDAGTLTRFWDNKRLTYGLSWIDTDNNGTLELITVGEYDTIQGWGTNYVHSYSGGVFAQTDEFTSTSQLWRVAPADYDGDGDLDLAVVNYFNGACLVQLHSNRYIESGTADFVPAECLVIDNLWLGNLNRIVWGDYDNDDDPDLALGGSRIDPIIVFDDPNPPPCSFAIYFFPVFSFRLNYCGFSQLFENISSSFPVTDSVSIVSGPSQPDRALNDLVWGDYDGDGYLDLASVFGPVSGSGSKEVQIHHNQGGSGFALHTAIPVTSTVRAVDWADFDGDGRLDLAVPGMPPKIYQYRPASDDFDPIITLQAAALNTYDQIESVQGIDYDNDSDLDLAFGNFAGPSLLFTTFAPRLAPTLSPVTSTRASSVAWGDADGDGELDLLLGAGPGLFGTSKLYYNDKGTFSASEAFKTNGFGPQSVALGDIDGDGDLDVAFGVPGQVQVYSNTLPLDWSESPNWTSSSSFITTSLAWGDADGDDDLDLLVGGNGPNLLFVNQGARLAAAPVWTSTQINDTRSIAWGDYNSDFYLDFAVGNYQQANQVYLNNKNNTFSLAWESSFLSKTTSVAWADYDGDGDLDLAVGNYDEANVIYRNQGGSLSTTPVWQSDEISKTTGLAWADWDNDGDLDLAVGNDGEPEQVYANLGHPGSPRLTWLWTSEESYETSGVAWGDRDGDGDLDLAISQDGSEQSGVYENNYVSPSHLSDIFAPTMPLPNNPSYVSIARPGDTSHSPGYRDAAYFYFTPQVLRGPTVDILFYLFDPDGTRATAGSNLYGDEISFQNTVYEFSLDGGGTWQEASGSLQYSDGLAPRLGLYNIFHWNAQEDGAVSDNALFRIPIIHHVGPLDPRTSPRNRAGLTQRASTSAVSPPFRIRALEDDCEWPTEPSISFSPDVPKVGETVIFQGDIVEGSGSLTFTWNFGDGSEPEMGQQKVQHAYAANNTYHVTLTVLGEACPVVREVVANALVPVGTAAPDKLTFLPLIIKSGTTSKLLGATVAQAPPSQVTGLSGSAQPDDGATHLAWEPNAATGAVSGYRIYRRARTAEGAFRLLATVPVDVTTYTDDTAACGHAYYVTAFNAVGESPPSTASYFSLPCQR